VTSTDEVVGAHNLFHTAAPVEFVTVNDGENGPTHTLHVLTDLFLINAVIHTTVPGPYVL
jgi:hypothetical protein